jgi:NAD(P)-dependent dehydrogenase (short-subunit alcohol dehydrogenase family)
MLPAGEPISKIINVTMATNVAGAAQTAETFIPLLKKAENPRIVFMSTGFGSLTRVSTFQTNEKWPAYSASKAAENMIMLWFWRRFPDMRVNACSPGFRVSPRSSLLHASKWHLHLLTCFELL